MLNVLRGLITTFIIAYFGWQYLNVSGVVVTAGLVYAYNEYILKLVEPVNIVFTQISAFQNSHVQAKRYHKLIEAQLESADKYEIERYKGKILYMILPYLPFNFLTRPDFIAYRHSDADNLERRICRKLGALSVAWTIRSGEEHRKAKSQFDLFIFDSFIMK